MSRIYRSLPPQGTKLGIAFSGGLDTEINDGDTVTILPAVAGGR